VPDTCPAARGGDLPVAVGVVDAFASDGRVDWILDDARPSVVSIDADTGDSVELTGFPPLAVPLYSDDTSVVFLEPSKRAGTELPNDPVEGPAKLGKVSFASPGAADFFADLGGIRDTPRPVWIADGDATFLVTPGTDIDAPTITVYSVDLGSSTAHAIASIPRLSSLELGGLGAAKVGGKLFVAWLDVGDDASTIRAAVVALGS
jgi:hypothetical protein